MFRKIVIIIVMLMPAIGAAARDLSVPELLMLGCLPAAAVSFILAQSAKPQDKQDKS